MPQDTHERDRFEEDAEALGFDVTRCEAASSGEPWTEYVDVHTGYRWSGWCAALQDTRAEPVTLRHSANEFGDCPHWCKACATEAAERALAESTPPTGDELHHELDGVIADVEAGNGFDAVCLKTVKRVRDAIASKAAPLTTENDGGQS